MVFCDVKRGFFDEGCQLGLSRKAGLYRERGSQTVVFELLRSLCGAEEMTRWSRAHAALVEDLGSVPNMHTVAHSLCNTSSTVASALVWDLRVPGTQVTCMKVNHTHKIKIKIFKSL